MDDPQRMLPVRESTRDMLKERKGDKTYEELILEWADKDATPE